MPSQKVKECAALLASKELSIAFAESATAGRASAEFALTKDSGKILKGGLVCYDACVKETVLQIPVSLVEKYTPESAEVTRELAHRLHTIIQADIYVGITGLTTAGGSETEEKPVGTMFIHFHFAENSFPVRKVFKGSAEEIILQTIDTISVEIITMLKDVFN